MGAGRAIEWRRFACAVVLNRDGCGFGSDLIEGGIVCVQKADGNIPVIWSVGNGIGPKLVVRDQILLFLLVVDWFQILGDVIPESIALPRLEVNVDHSPNRAGVVERTLR